MRELVVLGTASQVPTRARNHNGYFLRWDEQGFLFDPGEGTQRQMTLAGVSVHDVTRICVTHFHGDHCFGLPGVLSRMALDGVEHAVHCHYPAGGRDSFARLRWLWPDYADKVLREEPAEGERTDLAEEDFGRLTAVRLDHGIEAYGYRLTEPDVRRIRPDRLAAAGISGPAVGELQRRGVLRLGDRTVTLEDVSVLRSGQTAAFVMDTRLCDGVYELAQRADLLIIESTFLAADAALAAEFGHLTAGQAAQVAARCSVRSLVLTHFSRRYQDPLEFYREAREHYDGELVVAQDLMRVPVPKRVG
ncbi:ribonuclease Z [Actinocrinis puniceicyclus]|uniref:Ribonuclease Z n=1 Tax=Actinocrinis puniceicyclus TaxID=977794 RepID=A0A8J7WS78_9ACTN|nr:ribonuclease Z [Actinocrinis puniceicyclus]MBS2965487.1 ribonuclease Z [Actinocrinis puniceicyclus]